MGINDIVPQKLNWDFLYNENQKMRAFKAEEAGDIQDVYYFDQNWILRKEPIETAYKKGVKGIYAKKKGGCGQKAENCLRFPDYIIAREALAQCAPGDSVRTFVNKCEKVEEKPEHRERLALKAKTVDNGVVAAYMSDDGKIEKIVVEIPLCFSDINLAQAYSETFYRGLKKKVISIIRKKFTGYDLKAFKVTEKYVSSDCCFVLVAEQ